MPAGGVAQAVCKISCKGFARFSLEIPLSLETNCEPKTIPKSLQNRRKWRQNGSGDLSGEGRERGGKKHRKKKEKEEQPEIETGTFWDPKILKKSILEARGFFLRVQGPPKKGNKADLGQFFPNFETRVGEPSIFNDFRGIFLCFFG